MTVLQLFAMVEMLNENARIDNEEQQKRLIDNRLINGQKH